MKKIYIAFLFFCLNFSFLSAQTKLVAHKSHGGTNANFSKALNNDLFTDVFLSDFGDPMPRTRKELIHTVDSLIFLKDSTFLLISSTRNIHYDWGDGNKLSEHRYDIRAELKIIPELIEDPKMKDSLSDILKMPADQAYILDSLQLIDFDQIEYQSLSKISKKKVSKKKRKKIKKQKRQEKKKAKKAVEKNKSSIVFTFPSGNEPPTGPSTPLIPSKFIFLLSVLGSSLLLAFGYRKWGRLIMKE